MPKAKDGFCFFYIFKCSCSIETKDRGLYFSLPSPFYPAHSPPFIHPDPLLFSFLNIFIFSCEIFICEITRRAWLHAEENKRRTLQRSDVANAVSKSDQFDFLIDIIPREESQAAAAASAANNASASASASGVPAGSIPAGSIPAPSSSSSQPVGGVVVGKDGKPVAYENQYAHYFPQGGMAGYQHVRISKKLFLFHTPLPNTSAR